MAAITIPVEPHELRGLRALAECDQAANGRKPDVAEMAAALMHDALTARLAGLGLPQAPSPQPARRLPARTGPPEDAIRAPGNRPVKYLAGVLAATVLVVLWGGYVRAWGWTGFRANGQLWDWLSLLLLPVVLGILPLWIKHAGDISRARHATGVAAMAAFAGFAVAAYVVPLNWTGFRGQTLWNWFELLLLPATLVIAPLLPRGIRSLSRSYHRWVVAFLALAWAATIIGGYALSWKWTGYQGNTLWDWLQLMLLPVVVPTLLVPGLFRQVSGHPARPARKARAGPRPQPGGHNAAIRVSVTRPAG